MAGLVQSMRPSPYDAQAIMMAAIYDGLALAAVALLACDFSRPARD